jgi:site-specific recombinase XerD
VFSPAKGDGALALSRVWRVVREEADLHEGIGLHGLRHSVASHLAMGGASAAEIMQSMGHRQLSTVQRYIHFAEDAQSLLAERAAKVAVAGMAAGARRRRS